MADQKTAQKDRKIDLDKLVFKCNSPTCGKKHDFEDTGGDDFEIIGKLGIMGPKVLTLTGYIFPVNNFLFYADCMSYDLYRIAKHICNSAGNVKPEFMTNPKSKIAIAIEDFRVEEEYRGQGIGTAFMQKFPSMFDKIEPDHCGVYAMVEAYEMERDHIPGVKAMTKRLHEFYKRHGFKDVKANTMMWAGGESK